MAKRTKAQMVKESRKVSEQARRFSSGATRNADAAREDIEGFMSPIVVERFAQYMNKHRVQADGQIRESDNWQRGMPVETYMKGMARHFQHAWTRHRGYKVLDPKAAANIQEDLCAIIFNAQGYLFELLKNSLRAEPVENEKHAALGQTY